MVDELKKTELEKNAEVVNKGRSEEAKELPAEDQLSPLEQVKRMNEDTKKLVADFKETLDKQMTNLWLSGRTMGGSKPVEPTKEEIDAKEADKFLKFLK